MSGQARDHAMNHAAMAEHELADLETRGVFDDIADVALAEALDPSLHLARAQVHATLALAHAVLSVREKLSEMEAAIVPVLRNLG